MLPYVAVPLRVSLDPALTDAALRVFLVLSHYANADGWCWPSLRTLAGHFGISPQAVHKQIAMLVKQKHVERVKMTLPSGTVVTAYRPLLDLDRKTARAKLQASHRKAKGKASHQPQVEGHQLGVEKPINLKLSKEENTTEEKKARASAPPSEWTALKAALESSGLVNESAKRKQTRGKYEEA